MVDAVQGIKARIQSFWMTYWKPAGSLTPARPRLNVAKMKNDSNSAGTVPATASQRMTFFLSLGVSRMGTTTSSGENVSQLSIRLSLRRSA